MTQPDQIAAAYQTSATPQGTADRVQLLNQNGHAWMPADMQTTLATSQTSDQQMQSIADSIKQTLSSAWNGFTEAFHDPVLDKQPSGSLALTRYLTSAIGPLPVAQTDLHQIQSNLQKAGYGRDLAVDGVWDGGWNAQYNAWAQAVRAKQLAGNKPGSIGTAKAAHHWYDAVIPSHALNAIGGLIESLPGEARDLVANVAGQATNLFDPAEYGSPTRQQEESSPGAAVARNIQSLLGNPHAAEHVSQQIAHPTATLLQDVGNVLAIMPLTRTGSAAAKAAAGEWAGGVSQAAAQRGSGVIARSLFGGIDRTGLGLTADDNVIARGTGLGIRRVAERDALRRGPLNTRMFQHIPLLQQVGPVVGRLADADGAYYKLRTLLAAPYMFPTVRAAGEIGQRAMLTGGAIRGTAQLENAVGLGGTQSQQIVNARPLDTIDLSLQRITGTPYAHPFSTAVDGLGFLLHGPLGSTAASERFGDHIQAANNAFSNVLGKVDIRGWWERAATDATGSKVKIRDLEKAFGSPEYLDRFMEMKIADLAAAHHAQDAAQKEGLTFNTADYRQRVGELANEVWKNSDEHVTAINNLLAHDAGVGFKNRVVADMIHNNLDPKLYHDGLLEDPAATPTVDGYARNAKAWMQAGGHLSDAFRDGDGIYMMGPNGRAVVRSAQDNLDFGLGQDAPVRLLSTTRREYVNQVSSLQQKVQRQVNGARTTLGKQIADLEAAGESATNMRKAQAGLEAALTEGSMRKFADIAKKTIPSTRKTAKQWDQLVSDVKRLRALVDQGSDPEERLTVQHLVDQGVNPDELYTRINGEPRIPPQAGVLSGDLTREQVNVENGAVGVGKLGTKSSQQAAGDVSRFRARLTAAAQDPEQTAAIEDEMRNYGFREFGMDARALGVFEGDPTKLADALDERAHNLASELMLTEDAPQRLKDRIAAMRELGYRPMVGSHIGHMWDGTLPPMPDLGGAVNWRRKVASVIGVTPEQVSSRSAGQDASNRLLRNVGHVLERPDATRPPFVTAETVVAVMRDENLLHPDMKSLEKAAVGLTSQVHRRDVLQLQKDRGIETFAQAEAEYRSEMARALYLQPRDVPRKRLINALTTPGEGKNAQGGTWKWAGLDQRTANLVHRAVLQAYADRPGYIMGLGAIEDWIRGGFSILDKAAVKFPTNEFVQRAANLPNALIVNRNRLRFTLSPFFDFRRITKQNYKMGLDGVTPVFNPLKHMVENDTFTKAHQLLNKVVGDPQYAGFDEADRYLHSQSVWGLYNTRHFEAYYAWEKKLQGATDEEIRQGINRVFEYGSARAGGRSALERSFNTVFFPFSFEKTLIRNTGAYMLNHPQQALLLTGAMTAYDEANKHEQVHQWVQDHLPILRDLEKMNAFAHGISPGERGGINAPLLNLFLPQTYSGADLTKKNLQRNLPVWKDFSQLLTDTLDQARIGKAATFNAVDYATSLGAPRGLYNPYRPTITKQAQTRMAEAKRAEYITALAPVLQHNAGTTDPAEKITFPMDPRIPWRVRGKPINRTTIGELMRTWYPAYNPGEAAAYAVKQKQALDEQIQKMVVSGSPRAPEYQALAKAADMIQGHLNRGDYDTPQAADLMMSLRTIAVGLSEQDPKFFKLFTQHYKFAFGPLTEVTP